MKTTIIIIVLLCSMIGGWVIGNWRYDPDFNCVCWCRKPGLCTSEHCWCRGEHKEPPVIIPTETFTPSIPEFPEYLTPTPIYPLYTPAYPPIETIESYPGVEP